MLDVLDDGAQGRRVGKDKGAVSLAKLGRELLLELGERGRQSGELPRVVLDRSETSRQVPDRARLLAYAREVERGACLQDDLLDPHAVTEPVGRGSAKLRDEVLDVPANGAVCACAAAMCVLRDDL